MCIYYMCVSRTASTVDLVAGEACKPNELQQLSQFEHTDFCAPLSQPHFQQLRFQCSLISPLNRSFISPNHSSHYPKSRPLPMSLSSKKLKIADLPCRIISRPIHNSSLPQKLHKPTFIKL
eukprot:TRINITY_DN33191_c5_g1_i1.p1 TRINITY_DN33191_c5_g1~~TRINITY_DN33191_c5_g1_i1.p1  ORF type:complete len:121 (-),score=4.92 TRINITY_DN33191_c5_g1_i1:116-478(-)